jgi:hypothetical protein
MNLKRYLLICYGLVLGGLLLNYFAWWLSDPTIPLSAFIIFSFFQALFFRPFCGHLPNRFLRSVERASGPIA